MLLLSIPKLLPLHRAATWPPRRACLWAGVVSVASLLVAPPLRAAEAPITLGLISSGPVDVTKAAWQPVVEVMSRQLGVPVSLAVSKDYAEITKGVKAGTYQVAWVNNRMAIELVESSTAVVFAQMVRADGTRGYKSILLARKDGPIKSLDDALAKPGSYTLAMGDKKSTSGFLVPNYYIFAKNKVDPDKQFKAITHASHRDNFNTLAAGKADLAINNTEEVPRYQTEQAADWAKVVQIWESPLIPNDPIVMRRDLPAATQDKLRRIFTSFGQGSAAEKAALKAINGLSAFASSGNHQLRPIVDLDMFNEMTRLMRDNTKTAEQVNTGMAELTRRAAALDTAMSASRYLGK
jgi:phosphonate transport system substrate-binding protein